MQSKQQLQINANGCLKILKEFNWLLGSYVLDFFVDDHWNKLSSSWRNAFEQVEVSEMADLIEGKQPNRIYPLSFLALLAATKRYSVSRTPTIKQNTSGVPKKQCNYCNIRSDSIQSILESKKSNIDNVFLKRIKKKKRHEISLMSDIVHETADLVDSHSITDIGSGLGHLVRTLAYKRNMKTVGIEMKDELVTGARKLDDQFNITMSKYLKDITYFETLKPHHLNKKLMINDRHSIVDELKNYLGDSFGLIGLHPCGDLGPLLLKMFIENPEVKFVCIVGCCYMKLTCNNDNFIGYPLSEYVIGEKHNVLSYEARELACHAVEMYCCRLRKGLYEDLQIHCYRALLEKILVSKWPHLKHVGLKSIKHYNTLTFEKYCEIAVERLSVDFKDFDLKREEICTTENDLLLKDWRKVVIFYSLRLILAPLVESIILLDRLLYLRENGIESELMAVFDPMISPRNHILIARKS